MRFNFQQNQIVPFYRCWIWALFALSLIIFVLSICIISLKNKEEAAPEEVSLKNNTEITTEILISYIILSFCMFIGIIPLFINTIMVNPTTLRILVYSVILIFSMGSFICSAILLDKIEKEEEKAINICTPISLVISILVLFGYVFACSFYVTDSVATIADINPQDLDLNS